MHKIPCFVSSVMIRVYVCISLWTECRFHVPTLNLGNLGPKLWSRCSSPRSILLDCFGQRCVGFGWRRLQNMWYISSKKYTIKRKQDAKKTTKAEKVQRFDNNRRSNASWVAPLSSPGSALICYWKEERHILRESGTSGKHRRAYQCFDHFT
jgi:hypothetical protein